MKPLLFDYCGVLSQKKETDLLYTMLLGVEEARSPF